MILEKYHRSISFVLLLAAMIITSNFWFKNNWGASLFIPSSWTNIKLGLLFYSSVILVLWIFFLLFKMLILFEEKNLNKEVVVVDAEDGIVDDSLNLTENIVQKNDFTDVNLDDYLNKGAVKSENNNLEKMQLSDAEIQNQNNNPVIQNNISDAIKEVSGLGADSEKNTDEEIIVEDSLKNNTVGVAEKNDISINLNSTEQEFKNRGYHILKNGNIRGEKLEFFAIDNREIFFGLKLESLNNIIVSEQKTIEEKTFWFDKNGRIESPIPKILELKDAILEVISNSIKDMTINVNPFIIANNFSVSNYEEAAKIFDEKGIVFINRGGASQFKSFDECVKTNGEKLDDAFIEFSELLLQFLNLKQG